APVSSMASPRAMPLVELNARQRTVRSSSCETTSRRIERPPPVCSRWWIPGGSPSKRTSTTLPRTATTVPRAMVSRSAVIVTPGPPCHWRAACTVRERWCARPMARTRNLSRSQRDFWLEDRPERRPAGAIAAKAIVAPVPPTPRWSQWPYVEGWLSGRSGSSSPPPHPSGRLGGVASRGGLPTRLGRPASPPPGRHARACHRQPAHPGLRGGDSEADAPATARSGEHPHHPGGGGRVRAAGDALLDRQG